MRGREIILFCIFYYIVCLGLGCVLLCNLFTRVLLNCIDLCKIFFCLVFCFLVNCSYMLEYEYIN